MGIIYIKEDLDWQQLTGTKSAKYLADTKSVLEALAESARLKILRWDIVKDFTPQDKRFLKPTAFLIAECEPKLVV